MSSRPECEGCESRGCIGNCVEMVILREEQELARRTKANVMVDGKHTHWLYGSGPDKVVQLKVHAPENTQCKRCIHVVVCPVFVDRRCQNYRFGTSAGDSTRCSSCVNQHMRFDHDNPIPCFQCADFMEKPKTVSAGIFDLKEYDDLCKRAV